VIDLISKLSVSRQRLTQRIVVEFPITNCSRRRGFRGIPTIHGKEKIFLEGDGKPVQYAFDHVNW
jgi:hypothetical protein